VSELVFAVPGDLSTPTGGYVYDRRIIGELRTLGWTVQVLDLGNTFPGASPAARCEASQRLVALPKGRTIVIDGLAFGVLPEAAAMLSPRNRLIALVHHPLALESGLGAAQAAALRESERTALAQAHRVIATSAATARLLAADFGVDTGKLKVVRPGTDRVTAQHRNSAGPVNLLAVGALVPRKGYDVLIAALGTIKSLPWRLVIAGDRTRHIDCVTHLEAELARLGLETRVTLTGAVTPERLAELYREADLFVLASRFEGYGMAYAEAVAHGLPVIGTTAGAISEAVPEGAGLLVPPDDSDALATTLRRLIENPSERERLAAGACAAASKLPTWREQAVAFAQAVDEVA
jgi:glycosyltransferase involved in cell wall biosynthesis